MLRAGGKVTLTGDADNAIVADGGGVTLTNVSNTIAGAGTVGGNANLSLVNSGIVNANAGVALILDTGNNTIENWGTLEATSSGGLVVKSDVVNAAGGLIKAVGAAAVVDLDGATVAGGTLSASGVKAMIQTVSGTSNVLSGGTFMMRTIVETTSGSELTLSGTVTNFGTLFASGAGSRIDIAGVVNGGRAEIGNGIVEIAGSSGESVSFLSNGSGGLQIDGLGSAYSGKISGFGGVNGANTSQYIDFAAVTSAANVSVS